MFIYIAVSAAKSHYSTLPPLIGPLLVFLLLFLLFGCWIAALDCQWSTKYTSVSAVNKSLEVIGAEATISGDGKKLNLLT